MNKYYIANRKSIKIKRKRFEKYNCNRRNNMFLEKDVKEQLEEYSLKCNKRFDGNRYHSMVSLFFSFMLIIVAIAQYSVSDKQADIYINANKLESYKHRFEYYEKLSNLQKTISIIKKEPLLDIEEITELSYMILSLERESKMLFDINVSNDISKILNKHLYFLMILHNEGMLYDEYQSTMDELNKEYGNFLNSDRFKRYINLNFINDEE